MYPINHGGGQFSFMADHASNAGWPTEFFPDIGKFPSQLNISDSAGLEIAIIGIYAVLSGQLARNGLMQPSIQKQKKPVSTLPFWSDAS